MSRTNVPPNPAKGMEARRVETAGLHSRQPGRPPGRFARKPSETSHSPARREKQRQMRKHSHQRKKAAQNEHQEAMKSNDPKKKKEPQKVVPP